MMRGDVAIGGRTNGEAEDRGAIQPPHPAECGGLVSRSGAVQKQMAVLSF